MTAAPLNSETLVLVEARGSLIFRSENMLRKARVVALIRITSALQVRGATFCMCSWYYSFTEWTPSIRR